MLALAFSLGGFGPAQAQPSEPRLDASDVVAAQVDSGDLESAVEAFDSGDADGVAELAAVVAPQDGVDLDDSELVNLSPEGGLILESESGVIVGMSVQGAITKPEIVDGAAVATGVDTDLDLVSRADSDGAQILAVLGSKDAPNEVEFDLDLPVGAELATQVDGSVVISAPTEFDVTLPGEEERIEGAALAILGADTTLDDELTDEQIEQLAAIPDAETTTIVETVPVAEIETPWAVDADGNPVETRFKLHGDTLVQVIETTNDTVFPVVADPRLTFGIGVYINLTGVEIKAINALVYTSAATASIVACSGAKLPHAVAKIVKVLCMVVGGSSVRSIFNTLKQLAKTKSIKNKACYQGRIIPRSSTYKIVPLKGNCVR